MRSGGSKTLKEIKSVTVEKLTNKLIRSFAIDLGYTLPFILFILLQLRGSTGGIKSEFCYGPLAYWVLIYFMFSLSFAVVRLLKIPILRLLPHKYYFYYSLIMAMLQFLVSTAWFFKGNFDFVASLKVN